MPIYHYDDERDNNGPAWLAALAVIGATFLLLTIICLLASA